MEDEEVTVNNPIESQARRATITTITSERSEQPSFESSSIAGELEKAPWVDRVHLRHGMDWLDLMKQEIELDTAFVSNKLSQTYETKRTEEAR